MNSGIGPILAMVGTVSAQGTRKGGPNKGKGPGVNMHVEGKAPGDKTDEREGPPNRAEGQLGKTPPKHAKK